MYSLLFALLYTHNRIISISSIIIVINVLPPRLELLQGSLRSDSVTCRELCHSYPCPCVLLSTDKCMMRIFAATRLRGQTVM